MLWLKAVRFVRHAQVLVGVLTVVLLAMPVSGGAQAKIPRIGRRLWRSGHPSPATRDADRILDMLLVLAAILVWFVISAAMVQLE